MIYFLPVILAIIFFLALNSLLLYFVAKISNIKTQKYKTALIIVLIQSISASIINLIVALALPGTSYIILSTILIIFFNFFILHKFFKKHYQVSLKKSAIIYVIVTVITVIIYSLATFIHDSIAKNNDIPEEYKEYETSENQNYLLFNKFNTSFQYGEMKTLVGDAEYFQRVVCDIFGGEISYGTPETPSRCIIVYSDAGKKCRSSSECKGLCVTNSISQLGKSGVCQENNSSQGCWNAIENEEFECLFGDIVTVCDEDLQGIFCNSAYKDGILLK